MAVKVVVFPREVIAVSDIITLIEDIGNKIPCILYLLEIFNKQTVARGHICQPLS